MTQKIFLFKYKRYNEGSISTPTYDLHAVHSFAYLTESSFTYVTESSFTYVTESSFAYATESSFTYVTERKGNTK